MAKCKALTGSAVKGLILLAGTARHLLFSETLSCSVHLSIYVCMYVCQVPADFRRCKAPVTSVAVYQKRYHTVRVWVYVHCAAVTSMPSPL